LDASEILENRVAFESARHSLFKPGKLVEVAQAQRDAQQALGKR
jgi:hypothetical protein